LKTAVFVVSILLLVYEFLTCLKTGSTPKKAELAADGDYIPGVCFSLLKTV
jgi:hypothetical protein